MGKAFPLISDRAFVLVAAKGRAEKRAVTVGFNDGTRAEIRAGLTPDDAVITESRTPLSPGKLVKAVSASVGK